MTTLTSIQEELTKTITSKRLQEIKQWAYLNGQTDVYNRVDHLLTTNPAKRYNLGLGRPFLNTSSLGLASPIDMSCSDASKELATNATSLAGKVLNGCKNPISEEEYEKISKDAGKKQSTKKAKSAKEKDQNLTVLKTSGKGASLVTDGKKVAWIMPRMQRADGTFTPGAYKALKESTVTKEEHDKTGKSGTGTKYHLVKYDYRTESSSGKAYKVHSFNGESDWIPVAAVIDNYGTSKSDSMWVAAWALRNKSIQYSNKTQYFTSEQGGLASPMDMSCTDASKELATKGTTTAGKVLNGCKNPISEEEYEKLSKQSDETVKTTENKVLIALPTDFKPKKNAPKKDTVNENLYDFLVGRGVSHNTVYTFMDIPLKRGIKDHTDQLREGIKGLRKYTFTQNAFKDFKKKYPNYVSVGYNGASFKNNLIKPVKKDTPIAAEDSKGKKESKSIFPDRNKIKLPQKSWSKNEIITQKIDNQNLAGLSNLFGSRIKRVSLTDNEVSKYFKKIGVTRFSNVFDPEDRSLFQDYFGIELTPDRNNPKNDKVKGISYNTLNRLVASAGVSKNDPINLELKKLKTRENGTLKARQLDLFNQMGGDGLASPNDVVYNRFKFQNYVLKTKYGKPTKKKSVYLGDVSGPLQEVTKAHIITMPGSIIKKEVETYPGGAQFYNLMDLLSYITSSTDVHKSGDKITVFINMINFSGGTYKARVVLKESGDELKMVTYDNRLTRSKYRELSSGKKTTTKSKSKPAKKSRAKTAALASPLDRLYRNNTAVDDNSTNEPNIDLVPVKPLNKLEQLKQANTVSSETQGDIFRLPGEIGKHLQELQRYRLAMVLLGESGAGKTEYLAQLMDAFLKIGDRIAYFSLEQGGLISKETRGAFNRNVPGYESLIESGQLIILDEAVNGIETVRQFAATGEVDVIAIDSFTELDVESKEFNNLRKDFPNVVFLIIFQERGDGQIRGGNKPVYDAPTRIRCYKGEDKFDFSQNYAQIEKNRGNPIGLQYSMASRSLISELPESDNSNDTVNQEPQQVTQSSWSNAPLVI